MTLQNIINYKQYQIESAPPSVYYIPNFITNTEESDIKKHVYSVPKPKWTCLSNRRLQDYGGVPHKNGMLVEQIPNWLDVYIKKINDLNVFEEGKVANHVLINEYEPGQGIMPHTDGPLFYPTVTTINCLSHTVLEFKKNGNSDSDACKLLLEPRSLLILQDDMYENYLHSITERNCDILTEEIVNLNKCDGCYNIGQQLDRSTRLSVTIRNVPKVAKLKLRF